MQINPLALPLLAVRLLIINLTQFNMRTKDFRKKYENLVWETEQEVFRICSILNNKISDAENASGYRFFFLKTKTITVEGKTISFREVDAMFASDKFAFSLHVNGESFRIARFETVLSLLDLLRQEYKSIGNRRRLYGYRHNN